MIAIGRFISIAVWLIVLAGCLGCGDDPVGPEDEGDTARPTVVTVVPSAGDSTVSVDIVVSATFSEAMDPASMTSGVLSLDPPVAGSISFADNKVSFTPAAALNGYVTYTATVATSASDVAGNTLAAAYVWQFSTFEDTLPPTVVAVSPPPDDSSVSVNTSITAAFSEKMNPATINASSFLLSPSVSGNLNVVDTGLTFTPDQPLDLLQWYTATITTDVTDTAGNHLAQDFVWRFRTFPDTVRPTAAIITPIDGAVVGNSVLIQVNADDNENINRVEFYVNGNHASGDDDTEPPYELVWNASGSTIGAVQTIFAKAFDESGNSITTDTISIHYLWRLLVDDPNEAGIPRNISKVYYRSTPLKIQFRVETYNGWGDYTDSLFGIDVAFFLDSDQNSSTGDRSTDNGTRPIGDIGADHQMIVGFHGLYFQTWTGSTWGAIEGVEDLVMANDTNVFEVALSLARLSNRHAIDMIVANVHVTTNQWDWAPNLALGHATAVIDRSYTGSPPARISRPATVCSLSRNEQNLFD